MITNRTGILQKGEKKESKWSQTQGAYYKTAKRKTTNDHKHNGHMTKKIANDHKHNGHITKRREERKQMITNTKGILQNGKKKESTWSQTQKAFYKTAREREQMITNTRGILQNGEKKQSKWLQTQGAYYKTAKTKKANDHKHKGHITKRRKERKHMITNTRGILENGEKKESK